MRALHPRWRKCVEMLFVTGGNQTQALRLAGYAGEPNSMKVTASRLFADERVRKALREECDRRVDILEPEMMGVTLEIVRDISVKPADRLRAVGMVWDRANPIVTKSINQVNHTLAISEPERDILHYRALQKLGAPPEAFLQRFGPNGLPRVEALVLADEHKRRQIEGDVVEAEYDVIEAEPATADRADEIGAVATEPTASTPSAGIFDEDLE
jgi:phage terminase small subunit